MADAERLDQLGAGDGGRAGAVDDHADVLGLAAGEEEGVDDAGGSDDGGAMLVIVKDRNVHPFLQRRFDDEAFGRLDVLKVDAAKARLHQLDGVDKALDVFGRQLDVDRIDVGEALEQHRLAFHHRLRRQRAQIAEPQDRRAVRDDGDEIALDRVIIGGIGIGGDGADGRRHAGRIGKAQVALRRHRFRRDDVELAGPAAETVEGQRLAVAEVGRFVGHDLSRRRAPP